MATGKYTSFSIDAILGLRSKVEDAKDAQGEGDATVSQKRESVHPAYTHLLDQTTTVSRTLDNSSYVSERQVRADNTSPTPSLNSIGESDHDSLASYAADSDTDSNGDTLNENVDNSDKKKKNRTVFSRRQIITMETAFNSKRYLSTPERNALARSLNLSDTQVKIWFQNRRNKWKKIANSSPETDIYQRQLVALQDTRLGYNLSSATYPPTLQHMPHIQQPLPSVGCKTTYVGSNIASMTSHVPHMTPTIHAISSAPSSISMGHYASTLSTGHSVFATGKHGLHLQQQSNLIRRTSFY
ncbi:unnamed protein product [Owenia fusiformis]|uniref:Uncharacterized protein n=1 Tax=Owenia fusiformis TaxID=6347 RepID=A0A8J1T7E0_OWEFU|nr:unnamed protein product [Owenia fusiformis]